MMRAEKIWTVATYEFLSTVKRKGYLIMTLGMPLIVGLYGGIIAGAGYFMGQKENETKIYAIVDQAQVLQLSGDTKAPLPTLPAEAREVLRVAGQEDAASQAIARGNAIFRPYADEAAANAAMTAGRVRGYYVIPQDYLSTATVRSYLPAEGSVVSGGGGDQLEELLVQRLLVGRVPDDIAKLVHEPVAKWEAFKIDKTGAQRERKSGEEAARLIPAFLFGMLLLMSVLGTSGMLLQAVTTEKENKIVEVLLSSVRPDELLAGKLLGLGAAGLLQFGVWMSMVGLTSVAFAAWMVAHGVSIPWATLALSVVYFILAYLFVGSLMMGTGSLGNTQREAQQLTWFWTLPMVVPFMLSSVLMAEPNGMLARIMTWIPFTAPLTMAFRRSLEPSGVAWWEIVGSLVVLVVSVYVAVNFSARLFRIGLLLTGARPKLRDIIRQARLKNA